MNYYVDVINRTVEYIEDSISDRLSLSELSSKFDISDFHFNRMFKTVTGITLKQYILGRKLTKAMEELKLTTKPIIDIAMDLGFDYPEVFSRAFKKHFGLSPAYFRHSQLSLKGIQKAKIIERDIINYGGVLTLGEKTTILDNIVLKGISVTVNTQDDNFEQYLRAKTEKFIIDTENDRILDEKRFYTVVNCNGEDNNEYTVFCGRNPLGFSQIPSLQERTVPKGCYAVFNYKGDMFNIRETFVDDLYRWIIVKEVELNPNGIGMVNIYEKNYPENSSVQILIPVKE